MGLDFGTSCLKAVIGDRNLKKHYAVPFFDGHGIHQYLLPTRIYDNSGTWGLSGAPECCRGDLKLKLMSGAASQECRLHVIGYLALAIQRIRGWFFAEHYETYKNSNLLWSIHIGTPSAERSIYAEDIIGLTWAAWILAERRSDEINRANAEIAWNRAADLVGGKDEPSEAEDVVVEAIPEISAQVFGYVKSEAFDPNAQNVFLLADVGAGTVDCALFKVRTRGSDQQFLFYAKSVEPLGVTNLHKARLQWWKHVFESLDDKVPDLEGAVDREISFWDGQHTVPPKFSQYFEDVKVTPTAACKASDCNPDIRFGIRLKDLIQVQTLHRAKQDGDWHDNALRDTPFLLSGGGTRMEFYQGLKDLVQRHPSVSYLRLSPKRLMLPENIIAPGLPRSDWDRLSVAYGLSFDKVGEAVDVAPVCGKESRVNKAWKNKYIEK